MTTRKALPPARFFATEEDFRRWLMDHHTTEDVLWVGYYKKATGKPSIDWEQSRDQALCFGWIDGLRKSRDSDSFMVRFTPRRPGSVWSAVNIARVKALKKSGLMRAAGMNAFRNRDPKKSERYSFEQASVSFSPAHVRAFKKNTRAWDFFRSQPPSYRKLSTWWVIDAKKEETRRRRLETLIRDSEAGLRIALLRRVEKKKRA